MASTSETGHAKNIANFKDLIGYCTGYGAPYNPPKTSLQLTALNTLHTSAETELANVTANKNTFDTVTGNRQALFENLKALSTRIVNFLPATDASDQTMDDAKVINNLIQGKRATPPSQTVSADGKTVEDTSISTSRQSFDMLAENFSSLVNLVSSIPTYTPNEAELKSDALSSYLNDLKTANNTVANAEVSYSNSRIARDKVLYAENTGLVDTALDDKKYVKAAFGATSPEYGQVSGIKFTKA